MVSILAIEQLTGTITPKPVVISVGSTSSSGAMGNEAAVRIDDAYKALQSATNGVTVKQTAYDALNLDTTTSGKDCELISKAITEKKEDSLAEALKTKRLSCTAATNELSQAKANLNLASNHYNSLVNASQSGGPAVLASATAGAAQAAGGLDRADVGQVSAVAGAVQQIVVSSFNQDEFLFLCLKIFSAADSKQNLDTINAIQDTCLRYVKSTVELKTAQNDQAVVKLSAGFSEIALAGRALDAASNKLFDSVWKAVSAGGVYANPDKLKIIEEKVGNSNKCFKAGGSKFQYRTCFMNLTGPMQNELSNIR